MGNFKKEILVFAVLALSLSVGCTQKKSNFGFYNLKWAIQHNDTKEMKRLIRAKADVNDTGPSNYTALMMTTEKNRANMKRLKYSRIL